MKSSRAWPKAGLSAEALVEWPMIGSTIGPYRVIDKVGEGGMGEVYRARDTKLQRDVALKILPTAFASDPDRLMRFEREARTLAALNHPHIAQIYGLEDAPADSGGSRALVMELVEGEDLSARIARGPVPADEAIAIARQIAAALEAAHDVGIVHRDLKPANIKIRADGAVKVLDFGLAKSLAGSPESQSELLASPTITSPALTMRGVILGTAAYMSPEQAKGRTVDKTADVWAFGVVLFEMLAGRPLFVGETMVEVLGSVVKTDPNWSALPGDLPLHVRRLLGRCLEKNPDRRLRDIREARLLLEEAAEDVAPAPTVAALPRRRDRRGAIAMALGLLSLALAVAVAVLIARWPTPAALEEVRFQIPSQDLANTFSLAISPDGRFVAWTAANAVDVPVIWVRALDAVEARPLPGTEGAAQPAWSPDSRSLAYVAASTLMRVDVGGGAPRRIAEGAAGRPAWASSDVILFSSTTAVIHRVSSSGGEATPVLEQGDGGAQRWPSMLPDGEHFLFLAGSGRFNRELRLASLQARTSTPLFASDTMGVYAGGVVLFIRDDALMAQAFDSERLALVGAPFGVLDGVARNPATGRAAFDASQTGTLIYRLSHAGETWTLNWVGGRGERTGGLTTAGPLLGPSLSPDGRRVAFSRLDGTGADVWIEDLRSGTRTNLTLQAAREHGSPVWSPDGQRVAYRARRGDKWAIYEKAANGVGAETLLTEQPMPVSPMSWSADGKTLLFMANDPVSNWDIWALSLADRRAFPMLNETYNEGHPQLSPDGRWIAYGSNESGVNGVYVQSFPPGHAKWQVAATGAYPRWRQDGREIVFLGGTLGVSATAMATRVTPAGEALEFSPPSELFQAGGLQTGPVVGTTGNFLPWALSQDGERLLLPQFDQTRSTDNAITVIVNARALRGGR